MWPLLFVVLSGAVPPEAPEASRWASAEVPAAVESTRAAEVGWSAHDRGHRTAHLRRASRTVRLQLRGRTRRTARRTEHRRHRMVDADASLRVQHGAAVARKVARRTRRARTPQRIAPPDPHPPAA